jgi:hypothetical protein
MITGESEPVESVVNAADPNSLEARNIIFNGSLGTYCTVRYRIVLCCVLYCGVVSCVVLCCVVLYFVVSCVVCTVCVVFCVASRCVIQLAFHVIYCIPYLAVLRYIAVSTQHSLSSRR